MAEDTALITNRLLDELPRFTELLLELVASCGSSEFNYDPFTELLEFKSLVELAGEHKEPWEELWQRAELVWEGPNSLLASVPLFSALCERLLSSDYTCSLLVAALQTHLAVLHGWLEHATPAQQSQLATDCCARVLERLARTTLEQLPAVFAVYCTQQACDLHGAALLKQVLVRAGEVCEDEERQELEGMQQDMLQAASDALWMTSTLMHIFPSSYRSFDGARGLSEWARVLMEAEGCTWWGEDVLSVELPILLTELAVEYIERQQSSRRQKQALLECQGKLLPFVVRSTLRHARGVLEKCLQAPPHDFPSLDACCNLINSDALGSFLFDCTLQDEELLELWVKVLSLADEAWEALARRCAAGAEPPGECCSEQLDELIQMRDGLLSLHHALLPSFWEQNARASQIAETAALKCAAAAARALRTACEAAHLEPGMEGGRPSTTEQHMSLVGHSASTLAACLQAFMDLPEPTFSSPAARQPGAPRPPGALAAAAALDAVRLAEAVLRCALGVCREELLAVACAPSGPTSCSPASLFQNALLVASKWAAGKLPTACVTRPGLYLLQLARDGSGLDALLGLLATQRKLARELAWGLRLAVGSVDLDQLHKSMWSSLLGLMLVAFSLASKGSIGLHDTVGGDSSGSGGAVCGEMRISREKEAIVCLAIPAAMHLVSATPSQAAPKDIWARGDTPTALTGTAHILVACNIFGMMPAALRLGAGALLDRIIRSSLELQPSPRAAAEVAQLCVALPDRLDDLLPAVLHGGMLRRAVEAYLAWLHTDDFQVVHANRRLLETMELKFLEVCEAAAAHPGLPGIGPGMVEQAELLMGYDCDFVTRFPRTKREQAEAKEKLQHGWGLRARQLCPAMEQAARAAVCAELAPSPSVQYIPDSCDRPLVGAQPPPSLAAAIEAASSAAAMALARKGAERMAQAAEQSAEVEAAAKAAAEAAAPPGVRQAAREIAAEAAQQRKDSEYGQQVVTAILKRMQELTAEQAGSAEPGQPAAAQEGGAAVEAAEGRPGVGSSTPAPANGAPRPTALPMPSCPVAFAIRDIAVSLAGCANVHCRNLSGASELELPRLLCRGCLSVRYCSEACGREDWPRHGCVCRLVRLMRLGLAHCARAKQ